ncbi:MAG: hypothetical protein H7Z41_14590 [Cytophagales bacterium]|nr:hypothetical protein [Armatimonadota bacterium]
MSTFHLFVLEEELDLILSRFSLQYDLSAALQVGNSYEVYDPKVQPSPWRLQTGGRLFYLFPHGTQCHEDSRPRDEGWVQVMAGFLTEQDSSRTLTLTAIAATDGHANRLASRMRSHLKKSEFHLQKGIVGRNVKYGGESTYKGMLYSPQALLLHNEGVSWVYENGANTAFDPIN